MESAAQNDRLTGIETARGLLCDAKGAGSAAVVSRQHLVLLYHGAAFRYLVGVLHDTEAAREIAQDFALRFMRGDFLQADPERGRFRDYLKVVLRNMATDYWRKAGRDKQRGPLPEESVLADATSDRAAVEGLSAGLREELLSQTWEALAQYERETGRPYYTVLSFKVNARAANPDRPASTAELVKQLSPRLGRDINENALRQALHRAREKFAELLVEEVLRSLLHSQPDRLEEELGELQLLDYCRSAVNRRLCRV
jgi:RNA polymerase sigma-70 factor (ECF subfamily)